MREGHGRARPVDRHDQQVGPLLVGVKAEKVLNRCGFDRDAIPRRRARRGDGDCVSRVTVAQVWRTAGMVIVLIRTTLRADCDHAAYAALNAQMYEIVQKMPGFVGANGYASA